ncbi:MAG TPA: Yip1 family protein [Sphingomonas sp.]|nr:Yip1 family protein [Sphingomonas sp.]
MASQFDHDAPAGIAARAKRLILQPKEEWPRIDAEPMTVRGIMTGWVVPLAAIGPVARLIGSLVFGYGMFGIHYRPSVGSAITTAVLGYIFALIATWILALVVDALAPSFGGTKSPVQAMKVAAFSATAGWLAGIFGLVPSIAFLGLLGLYSLYLLYLGLPLLMKAPADKAMSYTIVTIVVAVVLFIVAGMLTGAVARAFVPAPSLDGGSISGSVAVPGVGKIDLAKLDEASKRMEAAANASEGKAAAGAPSAIAPATLQAMLPSDVDGWKRTETESSGGGAAGISGSNAQATYASGDDSFTLSVTDSGTLGSIATLGGALSGQSSKETATGYEKTAMVDGHMVSEKWDNASHSGSYGTMIASRFMVSADGSAPSIDTLKHAVAAVDPGKLQALAR